MKRFKYLLQYIFLLLVCSLFIAEKGYSAGGFPPPVLQKGTATVDDVAVFCGNNCIQDGGAAPAGTVSQVNTSGLVTGGPITTTGTISLSAIGSGDVAGNNTGSSGVPTDSTLTSLFDLAFGNAQGDILYRGATGWTVLAPGSSGNVLATQGASANPHWVAAGSGTVSSVGFTGDGYIYNASVTGSPVTTTGTFTPTQHTHTANSVAGALTATTLSDLSVPSCSTASSALSWTSGTGFGCNSSITASTNANLTGPVTSVGNATSVAGAAAGKVYAGATPSFTFTPVLGVNASSAGTLGLANGNTSGTTITLQNLGNVTTGYNWNFPITAGSSGNLLASGGGSSTSMTWDTTTGSGTVVALATSPVFTTPTLGAASATSVSFTSTSGIIGSTTNDSAAAGSVGELLSNNSSAVSMSTGSGANCTSISLTAGDWDVNGTIQFIPAATTVVNSVNGGINTTTGTLPSFPDASLFGVNQSFTVGTGNTQTYVTGSKRVSLASTTTVFLVGLAAFTTSTETCNGYIQARRRR